MGHYTVPAIPVADAYGNAPAARDAVLSAPRRRTPRDAAEAAADPWWRAFGDERLDRFVEQTLAVNRDLATASIRLRNARLYSDLADNKSSLSFDASSGRRYSKPLDGREPGQRNDNARSSITIAYEVDLWNRLGNRSDAARWKAEATAEDFEAAAISLAGTACEQYWTLALANQRIVTGKKSLEYAEKTLALVRSQFAAGAVSRLELRQAELSLQRQRAAQSQLQRQRDETRTFIAQLMDGQPWPRDDEPQDLAQAADPAIRASVPAQLLGRRPDLRAAELRLRAVFAEGEAAHADYYPTLALTGNADARGSALAEFLTNPVGSLVASLAVPLLNLKQMRLNNAVTRNDYDIATNNFVVTLQNALTEVDNAISARRDLYHQLEAAHEAHRAAAEAERLNEVRYRAGAESLRAWLDAQEQRRSAEIELMQTRFNQLENTVALYKALGGSGRS